MRKVFFPILYIICLLAVFFLAYSFAKQLKPESPHEQGTGASFTTTESRVGEVGGSHYLRSSHIENMDGFVRIVVETKLNRPSVIEDQISTPETIVSSREADGKRYLLLNLSDTTNIYTEEGARDDIYSGLNGDIVNYPPVTKIELLPATEAGQQMRIWVDGADLPAFRISSDPAEAGNLWIDIKTD